jgi:DNA repair protein RadC
MNENNEISDVAGIFLSLGAEKKQALRMATQLLKRAGQISNELNITKTEALQGLLETVTCGSRGDLKPSEQATSEVTEKQKTRKNQP